MSDETLAARLHQMTRYERDVERSAGYGEEWSTEYVMRRCETGAWVKWSDLQAVLASSVPPRQDDHLHPVQQVWFRAGLLACREYMARFVDAESPTIAMSIRANWWPSLGQDFGPPRQLDFGELTEGEYGTSSFRCKTAVEVSPTQEALPIALGFLQSLLPPAPVGEEP